MKTVEEIKMKRCEIGMSDVVYEGELALSIETGETIYLGAGFYCDVWGFEITKNSNYLYKAEGIGEEDTDYLEFYQSKEDMIKSSKFRKYFNLLISDISKLARCNGEYQD